MRAIENVLTVSGGMILILVVFTIVRFFWHFLGGLFNRGRTYPAHGAIAAPLAVVTLVHGTFARGAPWTQPGSALSEAVTAHFGGRVQLRRFDWSGRNSFRARARAAGALAADAARVNETYGRLPHYCIGHSHGGNVALDAALACRNGEIDGVVCLATPVLTTNMRHFSPLVRGFVGFGFWLILLLPWMNLESQETSDTEVVLMMACALFATIWYFAARRIARTVCETRPHSALDPKRVAFIRSPFDEASGIIGLANLMSWIVSRLTDGPVAVFEHLERLPAGTSRALLALKLAALALLGFVIAWIGLEVDPLPQVFATYPLLDIFYFGVSLLLVITGGIGFVGTLLIPLLNKARGSWVYMVILWVPYFLAMMIGGMIFIPAILLVSIVHAMSVGAELFLCSVFVEVTAEPCPAGNWTVYQLRPPPERSLRHSSVYDSSNGLRAVGIALTGLMDADAVTLLADDPAAMISPVPAG